MEFINLTPHAITVCADERIVAIFPPSGNIARANTSRRLVGEHGGVKLYHTEYGTVYGLPEPKPDTIYIVSGLIRAALPGRADLASPGELVRDEKGIPIGCRGLDVNA